MKNYAWNSSVALLSPTCFLSFFRHLIGMKFLRHRYASIVKPQAQRQTLTLVGVDMIVTFHTHPPPPTKKELNIQFQPNLHIFTFFILRLTCSPGFISKIIIAFRR